MQAIRIDVGLGARRIVDQNDPDPAVSHVVGAGGNGLLQDLTDRHLLDLEGDHARFDLLHIQNVVDEKNQPFAIGVRDVD
ncbi:hypothetical protein, partial [Mesorhizobium sp. M7A.F.Ca.CA.004.02.1.1]|uniref:hypothetical protein n=1 Tax=Mesorhizobium sp. M7A.F.Ca.CA.004.02.1.1 TaxID=2496690 RepID=UPI001FE11914